MAIDRNDPEVKELIEEVTSALAAKNAELLKEVKVFKAKAKGADIDPAEHAQLVSEKEELESRLKTLETKSKVDLDKLTKIANEKDSALSNYVIDAELNASLSKVGVAPHYFDAVRALIRPTVAVALQEGKHVVQVGDKSLAEHMTAWVAGDSGKHFVAAQHNSGGGAAGNKSGASASKKWADMSTEERTHLYRTDKAAYEAAKASN